MDGSHMRPPINKDVALDDKNVCAILNISKSTLMRWREKYGCPQPAFYVGQRGFTWRSDLMKWVGERPDASPFKGQFPPDRKKSE
jgi:predicted DNA-binding transcriptional regulator AlpA